MTGDHGYPQHLSGRQAGEPCPGQAPGLRAEHEGIASPVAGLGIVMAAACGTGIERGGSHGADEGVQRGVLTDMDPLMVVEARATQAPVIELESQGLDQMELAAGVGAQTNDIAGVRGYLGLIEDDMEHG